MENQTCKGLMVQYSTPPPTDEHGQPTSAKQFMRNKHKKKNAEIKTQNTIEQQHTNNTMDPFGFWRQTAKPNPKPTKERTSFGAKVRGGIIILSAAQLY